MLCICLKACSPHKEDWDWRKWGFNPNPFSRSAHGLKKRIGLNPLFWKCHTFNIESRSPHVFATGLDWESGFNPLLNPDWEKGIPSRSRHQSQSDWIEKVDAIRCREHSLRIIFLQMILLLNLSISSMSN